MNALYELINFPTKADSNGALTVMQAGTGAMAIPFPIKRVFIVTNTSPTSRRGGHTHHKTEHVLVALAGGCTIALDNGKERMKVALNKPNVGVLLPPYVWHTMQDFKKGTVLMVIASTLYDERDYIRSYEEFLGYINKKRHA
ncbi:MAG: FdtA/QdtA family cupin domain-containing protein [bacterium]|nr:FdtA/QdtA family cupin domain-containing protein [bacterium]